MDSRSPFAGILLGQPSLARQLRLGVFAALDQRIAVRYHIGPMDLGDSTAYLRHHLALAGRSDQLFADDAIVRLHPPVQRHPTRPQQRRRGGAHRRRGRRQGARRRRLRPQGGGRTHPRSMTLRRRRLHRAPPPHLHTNLPDHHHSARPPTPPASVSSAAGGLLRPLPTTVNLAPVRHAAGDAGLVAGRRLGRVP